MDFQRPSNIPSYADLCLKALAAAGLGEKVSLGGAFGLLHYLDYRQPTTWTRGGSQLPLLRSDNG